MNLYLVRRDSYMAVYKSATDMTETEMLSDPDNNRLAVRRIDWYRYGYNSELKKLGRITVGDVEIASIKVKKAYWKVISSPIGDLSEIQELVDSKLIGDEY